jgi:histidinol dehydrogenase
MVNRFVITRQDNIELALKKIRGSSTVNKAIKTEILAIINEVYERGDAAVIELSRNFDGVTMKVGDLEVPRNELEYAWDSLDQETRDALRSAEKRITDFSLRSGVPEDWEEEVSPGVKVGEVHRPLEPLGIYVPGGRFQYPSTVLMTGVPARVAGVKDILFSIPPEREGLSNNVTLAATVLVGNCRVFRMGGAQAIAAMAIGTETVPECRMIAGPGNVYVTYAKRLFSNYGFKKAAVKTDLEAGPSEIAVYVDGSTDISYAVSDVLAQLEHDPRAVAVIVSVSDELLRSAEEVMAGMSEVSGTKVDDERNVSLVRCETHEMVVSFLNLLAPEHLELMVEGASLMVDEITSAGCVFVGPYSAAALGDYIAGPSHVLPTGGSAAWNSGLGPRDFIRTMNVVGYDGDGFRGDVDSARLLARMEGLDRHAQSLDIRLR